MARHLTSFEQFNDGRLGRLAAGLGGIVVILFWLGVWWDLGIEQMLPPMSTGTGRYAMDLGGA